MELNGKQRNIIKQKFKEINSKNDLLTILNLARKFRFGDDGEEISSKSLIYSIPSLRDKRYFQFTIYKKSGELRIISAPYNDLKWILQVLYIVLDCVFNPHDKAIGFTKGKSIVTNAKIHCCNKYVYNIDIKDFFHSFDQNKVKLAFMHKPFNLRDCNEPIAYMLSCLCTHPIEINGKLKNVLPQGSPCSPIITNILCYKLDRRLNGLAKKFNANYSRYADDITFSSSENIYEKDEFINELHRIITVDQKLIINNKKIRLQKECFRQVVTGLVVNEKVNVKRRTIKEVRMWLYYWENYGGDKTQQLFVKDYLKDKGHFKKEIPNFKNFITGKLNLIKMVKGKDDLTYQKLNNRLIKLMNNKEVSFNSFSITDGKTISL